MATHTTGVVIERPDTNCFPDRISNQITATNEIGQFMAYVLADGGADEGVYVSWVVPQNYVGTPVIVVRGILDGAPGASDTLGFGIKGLSRADNEPADTAFSAEDIASATIGSSGTNHSDKDPYEEEITLSNLTSLAAGEEVTAYVFLDASATSYTGNFLLRKVRFKYADA